MPIDRTLLEASLRRLDEQLATTDALGVGRPSARLAQVVEAADHVLDVDSVGILLLDESGNLRAVASSGVAASVLERTQEALRLGPGVTTLGASGTQVSRDLRTDHPALARGLADDERGGAGDWAVVSAPITVQGQDVGNLNAVITRPHDWNDLEVKAIETFAGVVGTVLHLSAAGLPTRAAAGDADLDRSPEGRTA